MRQLGSEDKFVPARPGAALKDLGEQIKPLQQCKATCFLQAVTPEEQSVSLLLPALCRAESSYCRAGTLLAC
jgi:hypothetical protein